MCYSGFRWPRRLALVALLLPVSIPLRAQDSLAWEPVGDRPIKPRDLAFSADGALWTAAGAGVLRLSDPNDHKATWELRRDWNYALIQPLGPDTVLTTTGGQTDRSIDGGYTFFREHGGGWQQEGGQTLVEDDHGRLYVATTDGAARSLDRGGSWIEAEFGGSQTVHRGWAVLPLPDTLAPSRVLVGGLGGVSVAADAEADWTLYPTALWEGIRYGIESLVLVEGSGGSARVVATGGDQTLPHQRIWTSDDLGATWTARSPLPDVPDGGVGTGGLAAVFALGSRSAIAVLGRGNVYRTDDGAETWALVGRAPIDTLNVFASSATVGPDGRLYLALQRTGANFEKAWVYRTAEPIIATAAEPQPPTSSGEDVSLEVVPNPFDSSTTVVLTLRQPSEVNVVLYDALGRRVALLHEGSLTAGAHRLALDSAALAPGVYVVRAEVRAAGRASRAAVRRLVVAR